MKLLKLFIILSLKTFLSLSVLSLKTGYDYDTTQDVSVENLYKDLKCAYLFGTLTHMRLIKLMLKDKNINTSIPVGLTTSFESSAMIYTLYIFSEKLIGSLWIFHLYKSITLYNYFKWIAPRKNQIGFKKLKVTHNHVIEKLQKESADCRGGNKFDSYEKWHASVVPNGKPTMNQIRKKIRTNADEVSNLLKTNGALSTYGSRYDALKARNLFMNNLGSDFEGKRFLMTAYNVHVKWCDTSIALLNAWNCAHKMYWHKKLFWSYTKYYHMHVAFLKTIMFRLLWKNLLSIKDYTGDNRVFYLKELYNLLVDFETLLRLQGDPHISHLLDALYNLTQKNETIDNIIYDLKNILDSITRPLHCIETIPMTLDGQEFEQPSSSMNQSKISQMSIECNGLNDVRDFLSYLRHAFQGVNFDIIRSLIKYLSV